MEELASEFADVAHFPFVYTREAHPGETFSGLASIEQKVEHAKAIREHGVKRTILIDSLDGQVHQTYGGLSNMTWIVDHVGRVAFKASWTVATDIRESLMETLRVQEQRRDGKLWGIYYRETVGLRAAAPRPDGPVWPGGKGAAEDTKRFNESLGGKSPYWPE